MKKIDFTNGRICGINYNKYPYINTPQIEEIDEDNIIIRHNVTFANGERSLSVGIKNNYPKQGTTEFIGVFGTETHTIIVDQEYNDMIPSQIMHNYNNAIIGVLQQCLIL